MRGRKWMQEEQEHDRPRFDFMGKLMEWAQSKDHNRHDGYFYLDYLVDMEGFPEEMRERLHLTPQEHLNLKLVSISEERRFWRAFFFYQEQYEFENKNPVPVTDLSQTSNLEHCLRRAGIAQPSVFGAFREMLVDDNTLLCVDAQCRYKDTQLVGEVVSFLTGRAIVDLLTSPQHAAPQHCAPLFLQELDALRRFPVEVHDRRQEVMSSGVVGFRDAPTLAHLLVHLGLQGTAHEWYVDVRDFYSTPGHMVFTDYDFHNFLLDWWLQGKWRYDGKQCGGSKVVVSPRQTPEQAEEARRGWFHVV